MLVLASEYPVSWRHSASRTSDVRMVVSVPCGIGLISSYATGCGAVMAIRANVTASLSQFAAGAVKGSLSSNAVDLIRRGGSGEFDSIVSQAPVPSGVGLKTSSAFATAVVLSTAHFSGTKLDREDLVRTSIDVQRRCGLTTAGSVDDTWSGVLGGIVMAETVGERLVMRRQAPAGLVAVVLVPHREASMARHFDRRAAMRPHRRRVQQLLEQFAAGQIVEATTAAAFLQSRALGYCVRPLTLALASGASGVSLSGKGPARVALCTQREAAGVALAWRQAFPTAVIFPAVPSVAGATAEMNRTEAS